MLILTRDTCNECEGSGRLPNPIWGEFLTEESRSEEPFTHTQKEDWFKQRGYNDIPGEEMICHHCQGRGFLDKWLPFAEILTAFKIG